MASRNFFAGFSTSVPTTRARVIDTGLIPFSVGGTRVLAIVGVSTGGQPKTPLRFATPTDAERVLRGGDLLKAVELAFNPSSDVRGVAEVTAVRVNVATQASAILKQTGGIINAVTLTSVNYGTLDNQIKVKVDAATLPKTYNAVSHGLKVTVSLGDDLWIIDNILKASFSIRYVGAGSAATMTLNGTTLATTVTGGPGSENLSVDLSVYKTVQELVAFLDTLAAYEATVLTTSPSDPTANALDHETAVDIKTAAWTVTADLQAVVNALNSGQQPYITAARHANGTKPPMAVPYTYLAGGSEGGAITNQDWDDAFTTLETEEAWAVVPLTDTAAIHAIAMDHCSAVSRDGRQPRRAFVGAALGEYSTDLAAYITRATALNSDRVGLLAQGIKGFDSAGALITYAPYFTAVLTAGIFSGLATIGESATRKTLSVPGAEWMATRSEMEVMIQAGIIPIEFVVTQGFFRVARAVSTWRRNDAYHRVEISTGIAIDEVMRSCIEALDVFIGEKASPVTAQRIASRTKSVLKELDRQGVIIGTRDNPSFSNPVCTLTGDAAEVSFDCAPVVPLNWINVTISGRIFTGEFVATAA